MAGYVDGKVDVWCGNNPPLNINTLWYKRIGEPPSESYSIMKYNRQLGVWEEQQAAEDVSKENISNKSTDITLGNSDVLYPTQKAVKSYVDNAVPNIVDSEDIVFNEDGTLLEADYTSTGSEKSRVIVRRCDTFDEFQNQFLETPNLINNANFLNPGIDSWVPVNAGVTNENNKLKISYTTNKFGHTYYPVNLVSGEEYYIRYNISKKNTGVYVRVNDNTQLNGNIVYQRDNIQTSGIIIDKFTATTSGTYYFHIVFANGNLDLLGFVEFDDFIVVKKNKNSTSYKVVFEHDLNNNSLFLQEGSTLYCDGGIIKNGTINFNDSNILAGDYQIFDNVNIDKLDKSTALKAVWFGIFSNDNNDYTSLINSIFKMYDETDRSCVLHFNHGVYNISEPIRITYAGGIIGSSQPISASDRSTVFKAIQKNGINFNTNYPNRGVIETSNFSWDKDSGELLYFAHGVRVENISVDSNNMSDYGIVYWAPGEHSLIRRVFTKRAARANIFIGGNSTACQLENVSCWLASGYDSYENIKSTDGNLYNISKKIEGYGLFFGPHPNPNFGLKQDGTYYIGGEGGNDAFGECRVFGISGDGNESGLICIDGNYIVGVFGVKSESNYPIFAAKNTFYSDPLLTEKKPQLIAMNVSSSGGIPVFYTNTIYQILSLNEFKGDYNPATTYPVGSYVYYNGTHKVYKCILQSTGNLPTNNTYFEFPEYSTRLLSAFFDQTPDGGEPIVYIKGWANASTWFTYFKYNGYNYNIVGGSAGNSGGSSSEICLDLTKNLNIIGAKMLGYINALGESTIIEESDISRVKGKFSNNKYFTVGKDATCNFRLSYFNGTDLHSILKYDSLSENNIVNIYGFDTVSKKNLSAIRIDKESIKIGDNILDSVDKKIGFFGQTPTLKPTVTGSANGNIALQNLLVALSDLGLINNITT